MQLVTMPEHLDRPEMVFYSGPYELSANRDDRWAERLPTNVTRVMAENLSIPLGMDRVGVAPSRVNERFDYQVAVEFDRFERTMSGDSVLDAYWTVQDGVTRKVLIRHRTRLTTPVPDNGLPIAGGGDERQFDNAEPRHRVRYRKAAPQEWQSHGSIATDPIRRFASMRRLMWLSWPSWSATRLHPAAGGGAHTVPDQASSNPHRPATRPHTHSDRSTSSLGSKAGGNEGGIK
ncbi:PqiC family protein [Azospirillum doebereinerae]